MLTTVPTVFSEVLFTTFDCSILYGGAHGVVPAIQVAEQGDGRDDFDDLRFTEMKLQRVYVVAPKGSEPATSDRTEFRIWVEDTSNGDRVYKDTVFNGKAK